MMVAGYKQKWPDKTALCPECGQPDNCGDCDHTPLTSAEVTELGGLLVPFGRIQLPSVPLVKTNIVDVRP